MPYKNTSASVISDRFGPLIYGVTSEEYSHPILDDYHTLSRGFFILAPGTPSLRKVMHPMIEAGTYWGFGGKRNRIRSSFGMTEKDSLFLMWSNMEEELTDVGPFISLKSPLIRFAKQEADSFRTILVIPNGYRPSLASNASGDLHAVWEHVQPIEPSPSGIFSRYSSSIIYRKRSTDGILTDSIVIGKGFVPTIRTMNGVEYVIFARGDSSYQKEVDIMLARGTHGVFVPSVPLYALDKSTFGIGGSWFDQFAVIWDVDSSGMVHIIQRVYNYPFNKLQITHYSPAAGVQIDSLNDLTAQHRFRSDGSVSLYRIVSGTPSWTIEHFLSKSGTLLQKLHTHVIPSNVVLSQIVAEKNGNEHLLLQGATDEQNTYFVRNAASDSATVSLIGKGYIVGNSAFVDEKNAVLMAGTKSGKPVLLNFSLDSETVFQDFHFPLAVGNEWYYNVYEFSDPGAPPPPTQEIARADSMKYMPNGKQYIRITSKRWMPSYYRKEGPRVFQYSPADSQEYLRMDFSRQKGDTIGIYGTKDYQKIVMAERRPETLFGRTGTACFFTGLVPRLDSILYLHVMDSIGITSRKISLGPTWTLIGAKINGKEYGTILDVNANDHVPPSEFWLSQNYPNPFNPTTVFRFQLPAAGETTLKIFDVIGRDVATLVNVMKQPGSYVVQWDASHFSSGIYFAVLRSGGKMKTTKIVLMK